MQTPCVADRDHWPPDYVGVFAWRQQQILRMRENPLLAVGAREYYRTHPTEFIAHWVDTYDPRNAAKGIPTHMPFVPFVRQGEFVDFIYQMIRSEESGLIEKARDMGATWLCVAISVHLWLFYPGVAIGWGSRKEMLVDRIGDPSSIFEKIRMVIRRLPPEFIPDGFNEREHFSSMRIVNPETGATITGEGGDNIGRGGRTMIYFKDESAHYERPEMIEAALADNTRIQIDISSVNGIGNVFHRRRENGVDWVPGMKTAKGRTHVFVMDWRDHPEKTPEWYAARKAKAASEGLLHLFAQEVDRDYSSSVVGVVIPADWVSAAIDAAEKLGFEASGPVIPGLDVADEGGDLNALALRRGPCLLSAEAWGEGDTAQTTRRAIDAVSDFSGYIEIQYDCIGVGSGVKAEANRLAEEGLLPPKISFAPWSAAARPLHPDDHLEDGDPESPINKDFFHNLKAQGWWMLRRRFEKTYKAITEGIEYPPDELISIPSTLPNLHKLRKELSQATMGKSAAMKVVINKTPEGTRSPNMADAVVMAFWPAEVSSYTLENLG